MIRSSKLAPDQSELCPREQAVRFPDTLDMALAASGCDQSNIRNKPELPSKNGLSYIAGGLPEYIEAQHVSNHAACRFVPKPVAKLGIGHQTPTNRVLLENYFLPRSLEVQIEASAEHFNHQRYNEGSDNLTTAAMVAESTGPTCERIGDSNARGDHHKEAV